MHTSQTDDNADHKIRQNKLLMDSIQDALFILDLSGMIHDLNQKAQTLITVPYQDAVGKNLAAISPVLAHITNNLDRPDTHPQEIIQQTNGSQTHFSIQITPLENRDGKPASVLITLKDITKYKTIEDSLRLHAAVFNHALEGIIITDSKTQITTINQEFTNLTGYKLDEIKGDKPNILNSCRHDETFYRQMWRSLHELGRWQGEIWNRHKDNGIYPVWLSISVVRDKQGVITNYIGTYFDISARKQLENFLVHNATHDSLTGIPNRMHFYDRLKHALIQARRTEKPGAVLFIDLDGFKAVNDTYGHEKGDGLLRNAALRLSHCIRETDTVARIGGDEFAMLLENLTDPIDAVVVAQKIHAEMSKPFQIFPDTLSITASVGISLYPTNAWDADDLIKKADQAMYTIKKSSKGGHAFYQSDTTSHPNSSG